MSNENALSASARTPYDNRVDLLTQVLQMDQITRKHVLDSLPDIAKAVQFMDAIVSNKPPADPPKFTSTDPSENDEFVDFAKLVYPHLTNRGTSETFRWNQMFTCIWQQFPLNPDGNKWARRQSYYRFPRQCGATKFMMTLALYLAAYHSDDSDIMIVTGNRDGSSCYHEAFRAIKASGVMTVGGTLDKIKILTVSQAMDKIDTYQGALTELGKVSKLETVGSIIMDNVIQYTTTICDADDGRIKRDFTMNTKGGRLFEVFKEMDVPTIAIDTVE